MTRHTLNIDQFDALLQTNKGFALMARRSTVNSYNDFVDLLYDDIDRIFAQMARSAKIMQGDSEDRITTELISNLRSLSYIAKHDAMAGGHVDVDVELNGFTWLGEAKFDNGAAYLEQGFLQLTTRYTSGDSNHDCGGLLVYIKQPNALSVMTKWRELLSGSKYVTEIKIEDCHKNRLAFRSEHTHRTTGLPYRVRHIPLLLHFDPQDKSGLSKKNSDQNDLATPLSKE
jgi:hypothetical protein